MNVLYLVVKFRSMEECIVEFFSSIKLEFSIVNFRSLFGISPITTIFLWNLLDRIEDINQFQIQSIHVLWTLYFFKHYPTSRNIWYFDVDRKTFQKKIWMVIAILYLYLDTVMYI